MDKITPTKDEIRDFLMYVQELEGFATQYLRPEDVGGHINTVKEWIRELSEEEGLR